VGFSLFFPLEPVSTPVIEKKPSYAVIEDKANVTWTCSVEKGTRVVFQWLRDNAALTPSKRYHFIQDNSTLLISPVRKEDKGIYRCAASNPVSQIRKSRGVELNVYCEYTSFSSACPSFIILPAPPKKVLNLS
ncbi:hypothetical protein XENOCAPTIV_018917, partial [Xenoophorus captivus]